MEEGDCDGMFLLIDMEHTAKPTGALISNSYLSIALNGLGLIDGHNATLFFLEEALREYGLTSTMLPLTGTTVCSLCVRNCCAQFQPFFQELCFFLMFPQSYKTKMFAYLWYTDCVLTFIGELLV